MKRIFSILLVLCLFMGTLPMNAYAASTDTVVGYSDSGSIMEETPEATPGTTIPEATEVPESIPGEDNGGAPVDESTGSETPADIPEETPETAPEETPDEVSEATPIDAPLSITPFSDFTGGENEFFTRIRLTVTDRQGNPISGAVYGLYKMNGEFVEYLTSDHSGVVVSSEVPVETDYYIEEITPPTGFAPNTGRWEIILTEICAPSLIDVKAEYDPIMGRIEVIKTDESGNPLPGVGFYVYNDSTGALVDTILTGADGTATTIELPYGWYELYEYLVPQGFEGGGYYMAMIEYDGETAEVYVTNYKSRAYVRVYKTGNDERKIAGAVFSIYNADTNDWVEDITTNSSGYAYSNSLVLGEYYAVEKSVPSGYALDDTPRYFTLNNAWQTVYIDVVNDRAGESGKVKIVKTDDKENPLSGVVFGLYRAWDGKKLADLTTGSDGTIVSDLLIPQDYYLVELTGKDGYTMITGQIPFTIDETGTTVVVVAINPKTRIFGKVKVTKNDDAGNLLSGVRFGVYCDKNNLLQEMITGSDGTATSGVLNEGGYYLKELVGLPGYVANSQQYPFTISVNNSVVPVTVVNPRITGGVKVIKTDGENPLPGAVFGIYKQNTKIAELTTGADGTATSGTLYYGQYELRELATVSGYELIDTPIPFSILEQGAVIEITVANPLIIGGVSILKTDESETPLSGAVFGLYNEQEQLISELTTGADGRAERGGLVMGGYFLREHVAPEGFAPTNGDIPFAITAQGEVITKTIVNSVGYGTLKVIKTGESESGLPDELTPSDAALLSGVVFEVYRESDNEKVGEITTGEDGTAEIELPLGRYYLEETQTVIGYRLPEGGFSFALTVHGAIVELPIQNQREPIPDDGRIRLIKKAYCTGERLSGAVFGVYDAATDELIAEITTDENGAAAYELPEGDYYLLEQAAPAGFILKDEQIDFSVQSGETKKIIITNMPEPPVPGTVRLVKKAEGTDAFLPGAVFGLYDAATDIKVAELTTDENGAAVYELVAGDFYLIEQTAPEGFILNGDKIDFTIQSGETTEITALNAPIPPVPGAIRLIKKAESTDALLSGAVFGLHDAASGDKIAELTTDKNGVAVYALVAGDFYLIEQTAPQGFILNGDRIDFTVTSGEPIEITVLNAPIPSKPPTTGTIRLIKKSEGTNALLPGAVFGVYEAATDIKVAEITTDKGGAAVYELPAGSFYLRELKAPSGFKLNTDKIGVQVVAGETKELIVTNALIPSEQPDPTTTGTIRLIKKAEGTGAKLKGAVFGIYRASNDVKIAEITTDKDGTASYELPVGDFYLLELKAPDGFKLSTEKTGFTVKAGETKEITVLNIAKETDAPVTGNLYLIKKAEGTGKKLKNAVFGIYKASNNEKIAEITTDSNGEAVYELEPGDFYLRELKAPAGFVLETAKIPFTVKADSTVKVEVTNMREQANGGVKLIKRGPEGEAVSGAVFGIYKAANDEKVAEITTGSDGTAFYELAGGEFYLLEKTAPAGYVLSTEKYGFTITSGQTVEIRAINQRVPAPPSDSSTPDSGITVPKTSETFPTMNYILSALCLCLALLCALLLYRGRGQAARTA